LSPEVADARADVDLMAIDAAVDRAFHVELHAIADEARSSFLKDLAVRLSDVANLKTMVRAQHAGVSASRLADMLVADGSMSSRDLLTAYRLPRAELLSTLDRRLRLRGAPLASADGVDDLDVIADNVIVDTIKRAKHSEPGPDDIVEYVRARESEVQVLRVALLGKLAGLDSAALHRRMRASFR
jgi:vacuolar-type H+-ATPase subunit C/Vma6